MTKEVIYEITEDLKKNALISEDEFDEMYKESILNPNEFWHKQASDHLEWISEWTQVSEYDFSKGKVSWFKDGKINATINCIDRHLEKRADQTAIIWEGDDPKDSTQISYQELYESVCRFANALKERGVSKGDRVCIYMPMIPEAAYAMLACARIGAIHSVVFGGFSPESLKDRILDSDCQTVITADEGLRGSKIIPLKENVDEALIQCPKVHTVIVVRRTAAKVNWVENRDVDYQTITTSMDSDCEPETMDAEDPLFILYTSGSTGKPKGVLHTTGGYLLQAAISQACL